jgi:peptidoglycan hydrolase-like protein with peptidoglycan-binding domain
LRRFAVLALAVLSLGLVAGVPTASARDSVRSQSVRAIHAAGTTVKAVQRALGVPADGIYGRQTKRAVRRFQRSHGLTVDGVSGPRTLEALGVTAHDSSADDDDVTAILERIAECESGGDPTMNTGNGYFGKYQFSRATWRSVGGRGNPARASEAEQDRRARRLYRREGTKPWPVCGKQAKRG